MKYYLLLLLFVTNFSVHAQSVYKTPSGKKYHLASCRMVENVSKQLLGESAISKYNLAPCKICKPSIKISSSRTYSIISKAVGQSESVLCKGVTKKGSRCKHITKLANGYCYQHSKQNSSSSMVPLQQFSKTISTCGARTQSGSACKRKVKNDGYCYQHS